MVLGDSILVWEGTQNTSRVYHVIAVAFLPSSQCTGMPRMALLFGSSDVCLSILGVVPPLWRAGLSFVCDGDRSVCTCSYHGRNCDLFSSVTVMPLHACASASVAGDGSKDAAHLCWLNHEWEVDHAQEVPRVNQRLQLLSPVLLKVAEYRSIQVYWCHGSKGSSQRSCSLKPSG